MTTTITPTADGITLTVTLTAPLHHGAGSAGNTSLLRTHEVIDPATGQQSRVPYVSANSIRHGLRAALAWHTAHTLDITDGSLSKPAVDLLWSGGAITTTGAKTNLAMARRVNELYPALGLLGYAAQSDITAGTLRVSDLILVCAENAWRLPPGLPGVDRRAAAYRSEEFGTRHDVASTPVARYVDVASETTGTTQMIYDTQVLKPGATLHGTLSLTPAATSGHRLALDAALALWAPDGVTYLGARQALGWGRAHITGIGDLSGRLAEWTAHLRAHRDDILALIAEITG